jgi:hypothetical protein
LRHVHARFLGERVGRGRGLTILIGNGDRRSIDLLDHVSLRSGDPRGQHRQPTRGIEMRDLTAASRSRRQQRRDAIAQLRGRRGNHPRGNLFASDLE